MSDRKKWMDGPFKPYFLMGREWEMKFLDRPLRLFYAVGRNWKGQCDLLIDEEGDDVNAKMTETWTPLLMAAYQDNVEMAEYLIDKGARIDDTGPGDITPLILAVINGYVEMAKMFVRKGANVNARGADGWTVLTAAAWRGSREICELLVRSGADPLSLDDAGCKPVDHTDCEEVKQYFESLG